MFLSASIQHAGSAWRRQCRFELDAIPARASCRPSTIREHVGRLRERDSFRSRRRTSPPPLCDHQRLRARVPRVSAYPPLPKPSDIADGLPALIRAADRRHRSCRGQPRVRLLIEQPYRPSRASLPHPPLFHGTGRPVQQRHWDGSSRRTLERAMAVPAFPERLRGLDSHCRASASRVFRREGSHLGTGDSVDWPTSLSVVFRVYFRLSAVFRPLVPSEPLPFPIRLQPKSGSANLSSPSSPTFPAPLSSVLRRNGLHRGSATTNDGLAERILCGSG